MDYLYVFYSPVYGIDNFWETLESSPEREGPNNEKALERYVRYLVSAVLFNLFNY